MKTTYHTGELLDENNKLCYFTVVKKTVDRKAKSDVRQVIGTYSVQIYGREKAYELACAEVNEWIKSK